MKRRVRKRRYTAEEKKAIVDFLIGLKASEIRDFLEIHSQKKGGKKEELRERIQDLLYTGEITYEDIVHFIDRVEPWGKQHVFLFEGPEGESINNWRDNNWVEQHLRSYEVENYMNVHLPLILPDALRLSSITYNEKLLKIMAVERRDYWERAPNADETRRADSGEIMELRAFVHKVKRGLVIFEWDLVANNAMLQVSQLPSGAKYEKVLERFKRLVSPWLDLSWFPNLDIRRAIARLHEAEEQGRPEARSHAIDYSSIEGRRLLGRSPTSIDSLLGEEVIDEAMKNIRDHGAGHLGNFYWLPSGNNPLSKEAHVFIIGWSGRVNFTTPNNEEVVRYVLSRVRALSQ